MWLNTDETLQAATSFLIYNKSKDTRQEIILCKLEIFCFAFIKKCLVINTLYFQNHIYFLSCMLCLMNEVGRKEHCVIINKSLSLRFSSGTDIHKTPIDIAARYRQLFTRYEKCHSLLNSKDHFHVSKKQNYVNYSILVYFDVWVTH